MGIDFGFTEKSRKESKYARCSPYLKRVAGFYSEPPGTGAEDPWASYHSHDRVLNVKRLREERPDLYETLPSSSMLFVGEDYFYWNRARFGEAYDNKSLREKLQPYLETKPSGRVLLRRLPAQLRKEALNNIPAEDTISAWDAPDYEQRNKVCKPCPVRPLDERSCHLRFSSYPGMDAFRAGFGLSTIYSKKITAGRLKESLFSFPHIDRKAGELPWAKIASLMDKLEDVEVNKQPEEFANKVFEMISSVAGTTDKIKGVSTNLAYIPFVDEFISKYIYREEHYSPKEAQELLPYLETLKEVSDWAIWDADKAGERIPLIVFRNCMDTMIVGLKIAEKYRLEMYVSY